MTDYIAVDGETPFEEIDVPLVAGNTAIVHIDLQNDFLHSDGHYAQNGIDIGHMRRVIEPIAKLTRVARRRGVPIIWTRHSTRGVEDGGPFMRLRPFLKDGGLRQNTWGYEILEDLEPQPNDWYVEKTRLSGYFATNLDVILRGLKAETVIFTGVLKTSYRKRGTVKENDALTRRTRLTSATDQCGRRARTTILFGKVVRSVITCRA